MPIPYIYPVYLNTRVIGTKFLLFECHKCTLLIQLVVCYCKSHSDLDLISTYLQSLILFLHIHSFFKNPSFHLLFHFLYLLSPISLRTIDSNQILVVVCIERTLTTIFGSFIIQLHTIS